MQLSYELNIAEFKSALKLHARQKLSRRMLTMIYNIALLGVTPLLLGLTLFEYVTGGSGAIDGLIFPDIFLVTVLVLVLAFKESRIRSMFRAMYPAGAKNRVTSMEMNDDCILTSVEGVGQGRYLWTGVSAFAQNNLVALLYIGDERFLSVPIRVLSLAQRAELNDLVARHLVKK